MNMGKQQIFYKHIQNKQKMNKVIEIARHTYDQYLSIRDV